MNVDNMFIKCNWVYIPWQ